MEVNNQRVGVQLSRIIMRDNLTIVVLVVKEAKWQTYNHNSAISQNNSILINHPHLLANTDKASKYLRTLSIHKILKDLKIKG